MQYTFKNPCIVHEHNGKKQQQVVHMIPSGVARLSYEMRLKIEKLISSDLKVMCNQISKDGSGLEVIDAH